MFASACPPTALASVAVLAVLAVLAFATESPGAALLIWFLAIVLTCFFSCLFRMLLIAVGAAIAVPANATISAARATVIDGEGRPSFRLLLPIFRPPHRCMDRRAGEPRSHLMDCGRPYRQ